MNCGNKSLSLALCGYSLLSTHSVEEQSNDENDLAHSETELGICEALQGGDYQVCAAVISADPLTLAVQILSKKYATIIRVMVMA